MDSVLASHPVAPGSNPGVHKKIYEKKIVDVAKALLLRAVDSRGLITLIESI